jgi:amidase
VQGAANSFKELGADVSEVSIPLHRDGIHIWNAIAIEGATELMVRGNSMGTNWEGHYSTSLLDVYGRGRLTRAADLSETVKLTMLMGQYMRDSYHGRYYAKAQNLARKLKRAYNEALESVDLLLMPTLPLKATKIPEPDAPREEVIARALEMIHNTAPFDVSGHPAMNLPCGLSEGLPVGVMLIGRKWDEETVLRAAHAFEQTGTYNVKARAAASR